MNPLFSYKSLRFTFKIFSLPHIIALAAILVFNIVMVQVLRKINNKKTNRGFALILAGLLFFSEFSAQIWY